MKIIALGNRKGGPGKTTMAVHIASGLAILGYRVGLVDLDSQGHSSVMFGYEKVDGLFDVLIGDVGVEQRIMLVPDSSYAPTPAAGELWLLPSAGKTDQIPFMLKDADPFILLDLFEDFGAVAELDFVIVDTQPSSLLDSALYAAADGYIFVTEIEKLSFDGMAEIVARTRRFANQRSRHMGRETKLIGVIPNKLRAETRLHRENLADLSRAFPGLLLPPVVLRIQWAEAAQAGQTIFTYADPQGNENAEAWAVVRGVETRLQEWIASAEKQ